MRVASSSAAVLIVTMLMVIMTGVVLKKGRTTLREIELENYVGEVFRAMKPYYLNYANTNGHCFNIAPPDITTDTLVTENLIESTYTNETWFDSGNAVLSFKKNSTTGFIEQMQIKVTLGSEGAYDLKPLAYQYAKTSSSITFHQAISLNDTHSAIAHLNTSACQG